MKSFRVFFDNAVMTMTTGSPVSYAVGGLRIAARPAEPKRAAVILEFHRRLRAYREGLKETPAVRNGQLNGEGIRKALTLLNAAIAYFQDHRVALQADEDSVEHYLTCLQNLAVYYEYGGERAEQDALAAVSDPDRSAKLIEEAATQYQRSILAGSLFRELITLYVQKGPWKDTREAHKRRQESFQTEATAHYHLGDILCPIGRYHARAREEYEAALSAVEKAGPPRAVTDQYLVGASRAGSLYGLFQLNRTPSAFQKANQAYSDMVKRLFIDAGQCDGSVRAELPGLIQNLKRILARQIRGGHEVGVESNSPWCIQEPAGAVLLGALLVSGKWQNLDDDGIEISPIQPASKEAVITVLDLWEKKDPKKIGSLLDILPEALRNELKTSLRAFRSQSPKQP